MPQSISVQVAISPRDFAEAVIKYSVEKLMKLELSIPSAVFLSRCSSSMRTLAVVACLCLVSGCGSRIAPAPQPTPGPTGTTSVTVMMSSTANGQFTAFPITLNSISLTNRAGQTVPLLTTPQIAEFIHMNAAASPLVTATVPQDVYTSATVMYSNPSFTYMTTDVSKSIHFNTDSDSTNVVAATVNLASPITISGESEGLALDLQVSKSATCSCAGSPPEIYSITPVFDLAPVVVSSQPTNATNGKMAGIRGRVVSVNSAGNGVSLAVNNGWSFPFLQNGPNLSVSTNSGTIFQGIGGLASITPGTFVDMDAAIQQDGTMMATRLEVQDPTAKNVMVGPLVGVSSVPITVFDQGRQQQGDDLSQNPINFSDFSFVSSVYQISGRFNNPQGLPFTPAFDSASLAVGQNVAISFGTLMLTGSGPGTAAEVVALMPQTLNGSVFSVSTSGTFTVYQVALAANDLIPTLNGATSIFAYVDGSTQMLTTSSIGAGSLVRFTGFLFNDAGTLRMVVGQANNGVTE